MPSLTPGQVQQIHEYIHNQQLIHAIKLYREATGVGLAEAKEAVEAMARDEYAKPPLGAVDYDNLMIEARIKSLLATRQKVDAVKIYREEYGVGLKQAKNAVDRIEVSMKQNDSYMRMPSAISDDPFAESEYSNRQKLVILSTVIAVALCGAAVFFLMMNF